MDVRCDRCGTEYEFDETLLSPSGTAVRCGHCQFAFRVMPQRAVEAGWVVRRDDGIHVAVSSLADLRARIRRGELAVGDSIARKGDPWKLLGEIAELASTFDSARTVRKPRPERPPQASELSTNPLLRAERPLVEAAPPASDPSAEGRRAARTVPASSTKPAGEPLAAPPTVATRPRRDVAESNPPPSSSLLRGGATRGAPTAGGKPRLILALDDDEIPSRVRGSRIGVVGLIVAIVAAAGVAMFFHTQQAERAAAVETATTEAFRGFADDRYESYRTACAALGTAHEAAPDASRAPALIARCHARWAQALRDEAAFEADEPRARSLEGLAAEHVAEAQRFAARAVESDAASPEAHLSLADASRLTGDTATAERELARAEELGTQDGAEVLRVRAEIAASGDDHTAALAAAQAAAQSTPEDLRCQALVARTAFEARDIVALGAALTRLRDARPPHAIVPGIERAIADRAAADALDAGVPPSRQERP